MELLSSTPVFDFFSSRWCFIEPIMKWCVLAQCFFQNTVLSSLSVCKHTTLICLSEIFELHTGVDAYKLLWNVSPIELFRYLCIKPSDWMWLDLFLNSFPIHWPMFTSYLSLLKCSYNSILDTSFFFIVLSNMYWSQLAPLC